MHEQTGNDQTAQAIGFVQNSPGLPAIIAPQDAHPSRILWCAVDRGAVENASRYIDAIAVARVNPDISGDVFAQPDAAPILAAIG